MKEIINWAAACTECELCMDICPTYKVTQNPLFSPPERLKTAVDILEGKNIDDLHVESIYNCPKCMACESICPENIPFTSILHEARKGLVKLELGPTKKHDKVINSILKEENSVNGDPSKRLNWLPEDFIKRESDVLLYLGCLPSYLIKSAASSSYMVLKQLGIDFMILEDEGCCGTYIYESGCTDLAENFFRKNVERFDSLGIREILVPCNGCLKCFKYFYPDLLGKTNFKVKHVVEVIYSKLKDNPEILNKNRQIVTYQDQCRLSRGEGKISEPRQILEWCGVELKELESNQDTDIIQGQAFCCGAGAGIRSVYPNLSMDIATDTLNKMPSDSIITSCPFCNFNLSYTSKAKGLNKDLKYITELVLQAL